LKGKGSIFLCPNEIWDIWQNYQKSGDQKVFLLGFILVNKFISQLPKPVGIQKGGDGCGNLLKSSYWGSSWMTA